MFSSLLSQGLSRESSLNEIGLNFWLMLMITAKGKLSAPDNDLSHLNYILSFT